MRTLATTVAVILSLSLLLGLGSSAYRSNTAVAQQPSESSSEKDELVRDVVTLDQQIEDLDSRIAVIEGRTEDVRQQIVGLQRESEEKRDQLASKRESLAARAREMYINGRHSKLIVLFSSEDVSDFFKRSEMLETIAERDAELIDSVKRESAQLEQTLAELEQKEEDLDRFRSEFEAQRDGLTERRNERQQVLAEAGENSQEIEEESRQVDQKIEEVNEEQGPADETPPVGRVMMMMATAYSPEEPGLSDTTASGMKAQRGVVAVDPSVIPLGTRLHVEGYGYAIAADTGSAIKGNRIDLCFDTLEECNSYGWREVKVTILD